MKSMSCSVKGYQRSLFHLLISCLVIFALAAFSAPTRCFGYSPVDQLKDLFKGETIMRQVPAKPFRTVVGEGVQKDIIVVKFAEGSKIRLREGQLVSLEGRDLGPVRNLLSQRGVLTLRRLFTRPEQTLDAERLRELETSKVELADLNLYYSIKIDTAIIDPEPLIDALNTLAIIEIAYPDPIIKPQVAGIPVDILPLPTPNLFPNQGYLNAAPDGIDATWAWDYTRGRGITMVNIDDRWNLNHEDIELYPTDILNNVNGSCTLDAYHGTAMIGVVKGYNNSFGVTGIASDVNNRMVSYCIPDNPNDDWPDNYPNVPDAINFAASTVGAGDIIHFAVGAQGPSQAAIACNPNCASCPGTTNSQFEHVALEYWQAGFDAIQHATANGVVVVEAAGNGQMDLDAAVYGGRFNRSFRDSGALLVGAGTSTAPHSPKCLSNHGNRVDVQGWGESVTTTGYGQGEYGNQPCNPMPGINDINQYYTLCFSGTSSATPIVAGAAALIQSYYKNTLGWTYGLSPYTMRKLLTETGTPQAGTNHIGPLPNLQAALTTVLAPPIPDIKANNSDGPINVSSSTLINITTTLSTGYFEQTNADVWVVAYVTDLTTSWTGWFYLGPAGEWKYYDPLFPNVEPVLQTSLVNLSPTTILNSTLPPGYTYTFYFGVDLSMNKPQGLIDTPLYLDSVAVTVPALTTRQAQWIILPIAPEKMGVFRSGVWVLDKNGNRVWDGAPPDLYYTFGLSTDKLIAGDWNGDGKTEIGVFRSTTWLLDYNGNGVWESGTDTTYTFGLASDMPVSGDWTGSGVTKIGTFRSGLWALDMNGNGVWEPGTDRSFTFGLTTDAPVTGDWNGDGKTEVGVFRDVTGSGYWYLDLNGNNVWEGCSIDGCYHFGIGTDLPVPGDWNGDGITDLGTLRAGTWLLDLNGNRGWDGPAIDGSYTFGLSGDKPVAGGW